MSQTYLVYDERMELHEDGNESTRSEQFERPERIVSIIEKLVTLQSRLQQYRQLRGEAPFLQDFEERGSSVPPFCPTKPPFIHLSCKPASQEIIELAHTTEYYNKVKETSCMSTEQLNKLPNIDCTVTDGPTENDDDMYFCDKTFQAAQLACGGVIQCVEAVTSPMAKTKRALAVVRPPGHHACRDQAMGFCFFNSVVVAAKHAINVKRAKKVAILDLDVHHGNGSQDLTYLDKDILYISIHRKDRNFFPGTGDPKEVGGDKSHPDAVGLNVNIAWKCGRMGNVEYAAAMSEVVLPLLQGFGADLVIISGGFDAARGDLIGDCDVMPDMYYLMTVSILEALGDIPLVVALEGGYNTDVIACCMEAVALALLNEKWDDDGTKYSEEARDKNNVDNCPLNDGRRVLSAYWDHYSNMKSWRGEIKDSAIRDINKTIRQLRRLPFWSDLVNLVEIPKQVTNATRVTRSRSTKVDESLEMIDTSLQSLVL
jgi:acetoin utilization deacetylase AcuC-like enzyme